MRQRARSGRSRRRLRADAAAPGSRRRSSPSGSRRGGSRCACRGSAPRATRDGQRSRRSATQSGRTRYRAPSEPASAAARAPSAPASTSALPPLPPSRRAPRQAGAVDEGRRSRERRGPVVDGLLIDLHRRAHLDDRAVAEQDDPVGHGQGLIDVVGGVHRGRTIRVDARRELRLQLALERARRGAPWARRGGRRPVAAPAPAPARRAAARHPRARPADGRRGRRCAAAPGARGLAGAPRPADPCPTQRVRHRVQRVEVRPQAVVLEDHGHGALLRGHAPVGAGDEASRPARCGPPTRPRKPARA